MYKKINKNRFGVIEYTIDNEEDLDDIKIDNVDNTVYAIMNNNGKELIYLYSSYTKKWILINDTQVEINSINEQLETINSDYLYNIENGIKYFNMQVYPTISFWGDSITAASETNRTGGYVFDFRNNIALLKGIVGEGWRGVTRTSGTVTELTEGINKYIWTTNNTASKIWLDDIFIKSKETWVEVFYTTKPDGGECEIVQSYNSTDTVLATINCNGELSYEKSIKVKLVANGKLYCRCKTNNPIYINGFRQNFIKTGCLVNKIGHGGIKLRDYNEQEITATLKMNPSDLYVFALGANDSPSTEEQFLVFENLYDFAIRKAREIKPNVSILLFITCRNKNADNEKFQRYKDIFYKLAKLYNCAVVDIDGYWGGWHKALELGYMQENDIIHPTMLGHKSMCEVLTKQLLKNPNILNKYTFDGDTVDVFDQDYNIVTDNNKYEMNNLYMNFPDDNNNRNIQKIKPVKNCRSDSLPKRAEINQQVFNQDVGYPMWCNKGTTYNTDGSVNSSATWRNAYGYELRQIRAEAVTSLNGPSSTEVGRLQIYNSGDDRALYVTTYNKLTGENWKVKRIDGSFLDVVYTLPTIPTGEENKYRGWMVLLVDNSGSDTSEDIMYIYKKKNNTFQWVQI